MTKNDLIRELAVSEKLLLSTAVKAVDGAIRIIINALIKGEEVSLRGFGTFSKIHRAERSAVNLVTKDPIIIPAHNSVKFKVSKELKEALNQ